MDKWLISFSCRSARGPRSQRPKNTFKWRDLHNITMDSLEEGDFEFELELEAIIAPLDRLIGWQSSRTPKCSLFSTFRTQCDCDLAACSVVRQLRISLLALSKHTCCVNESVYWFEVQFNNHGPTNNPNFVKKVGTFFGLGTQLKRMK